MPIGIIRIVSSFGHRQLYDDYNRTKEGAIAVEYIVLDMEWNQALNFTLSENQQGSFIVTFAPPVSFEFSSLLLWKQITVIPISSFLHKRTSSHAWISLTYYYYTERRMKWQSQLFYCQFLLLPYLDVTPVSQQRASPIRAGPLCTKRHTFWLMAFLVDRNQICVSKCHKQISEIFQKTMDIMVQFFSIKRRPFPMLALQSH